MSKSSIPKGTRDFLPNVMAKRNFIFETIKKSFQIYGFEAIETPAIENLKTLTGKYGEEGDQLLFKILSRGEKFDSAVESVVDKESRGAKEHHLCDLALRYDLTVPFARFVVQNQNEISFPFRRYQLQSVWRGDRPARGRYREFVQCDADVVGTDSLVCEVELVQLIDEVLTNLGIPDFTIKLNNRKILTAIAEVVGESDKMMTITMAIDKLDKVGEEGVVKELSGRGVSDAAIEKIRSLFSLGLDAKKNLETISKFVQESEVGKKGLEELEFIFNTVEKIGLRSAKLEFDVSLARGLNYYTGAIFEVKANGVSIGSIVGGGRYDNLTGIFGLKDVSGVGISFGADRIFDVMEGLKLFPEASLNGTQLLFVNFGPQEEAYCLKLLNQVRKAGVSAEIYPKKAKMNKQMTFANRKGIKHVAMVGSEEVAAGNLTVKNMDDGSQQTLTIEQLISQLK